MLTIRMSLIDPSAPPSALAPLSETTQTTVLSSSARSRKKSSTRPICSSACDRKPAKHSMKRAATAWSRPLSESAGRHPGRARRQRRAGAAAGRLPAGGRTPARARRPSRRRTGRGSAHASAAAADAASGRRPWRSRGRTACPRRRRADRRGTRLRGRPGRRSGDSRPRPSGAGGRCGCRGRGRARTDASRRRGTRTSGRSRGPAARSPWRRPCSSRAPVTDAICPPRRWRSPPRAGSRVR